MAKRKNIFARLFSSQSDEKKVEESIIKRTNKDKVEDKVNLLATGQLTLLEGTDVSNEDETKLIALYRQMENDAVISAALDLYADSATQVNQKTKHVVAVESTNKTFEKEINEFLWKKVKIDTEAWQIARDVARDGKILLDTMQDVSDWSFVPVDDPSTVKALTSGQDNIKYFAVTKEEDQEKMSPYALYRKDKTSPEDYLVVGRDNYIAGFNSRETRGTMVIQSESKFSEEPQLETFKVRTGRSILANVVQTFQVLSSLEDAMFINRLTKSTEFKVVTIDVGEGTNNKQAKQMVEAVKNAIKSSETIDSQNERYHSRQSPIPINDWIYIPTKGTKGTVTIETVGGEIVEAKTADIDYYRNKLFAGLGVLKAYLGFEETTPGGLGDSTLTKLDERFGRRIIRLQSVLTNIIRQIVEFYWRYSATSMERTADNMPEYDVILGKVSTKEEEERTERLKDSLDIADRIVGMLKDEDFEVFVDKEKLFNYIFEDIVGLDISAFKAEASPEDINIKVHDLKESKNRKRKALMELMTDPIDEVPSQKLKDFFNDHEVFLDTGGEIIPLHEALYRTRYKRLYLEKTYRQLKNLSKEKDPERLKKSKKLTAKYTGLDDENNITFRITAEDPEENKKRGRPTSYKTKVSLKDLAYLIKAAREEEEEGDITDKDLVLLAMQGDVDVSCECPAAKYWGQQYNGTKGDYSLDKNTIPPETRIPTQPICKHTIATLTVLPFWWNSIIRDLRKKDVLPSAEEQDKKTKEQSQELKDNAELEELEAEEKARGEE
jgi:hypothetical protein